MTKHEALKTYFGHDTFRPGQEAVIDSLLSGRDVLAVMPTGAGKSACYQIPALISEGVTLVISPLISLMKDQVNALCAAGVPAAYINSSLTPAQYDRVCAAMAAGAYRLVYVAPERLDVPSFVGICRNLSIPFVAVDEAHCVSQWGQDFRPGYLHIARFLTELPSRPTVGAFTATATDRVRADIVRLLELRDPFSLTTGFDRPNLWFGIRHLRPREKMDVLTAFLDEREGESGIVYCSTRALVEEVCENLVTNGYAALAYHAGMSDEDRRRNQEDFLYDRRTVMVATNAFGMGIDKSNVSFVVHYNVPKSMEAYYQEAGRAGRDGSEADCLLLYSAADLQTARFLIENSEPNPDLTPEEVDAVRARDYERLRQMGNYATSTTCLRRSILAYFGEMPPPGDTGHCGNCSNCNGGLATVDITTEAQMVLSCIARTGQRLGLTLIEQILRGAKSGRVFDMGLDKQTTYGLMKKYNAAYIKIIIRHLIAIDAIRQAGLEYPILTLGPAAGDILYRRAPVAMTRPSDIEPLSRSAKKEADREARRSRRAPRGMASTGEASGELYRALCDLRTTLAATHHIPPYYIFSNATLQAMAAHRPRTREELLKVSGVGHTKLERYGEAFLSCIALHGGDG